MSTVPSCLIWSPYRVCLVLPTVEFMTVIEDVLISRVEAGFHAILHNLAGSGRALEFLHLEGWRGHGWVKLGQELPRKWLQAILGLRKHCSNGKKERH